MAVERKHIWYPCKLASRGVFYRGADGNPLLPNDGEVQLRKLTSEEEALLMSGGMDPLARFSQIIVDCVKLPAGLSHSELLSSDRHALLLAQGRLTHGNQYTYNWRCQWCKSTANKSTVNVADDLDENTPDVVARKYAEKHNRALVHEEPFTVKVTDAEGKERELGLRFLRGKDEAQTLKSAKRSKQVGVDKRDMSYIISLATQIVTVDGETPSYFDVEALVRGLDGSQTAIIRGAISERSTGIDMTVYPKCANCGADCEMALPMDLDYFLR